VAVAPVQRYLCEHKGQRIPLQRGNETYQIVVVDDDQLAATTTHWFFRLNEDDLEQMKCWLKGQLV
jgi:hypothetical protein